MAEVKYENNMVRVNGKYYVVGSNDGKPYMKEVKKKDVMEKYKIIDDLTPKLKDSVDGEKVIREALMNMKLDRLRKLNKTMKSKKEYKPKTRGGYCADMKVGKFIIPIVD